MPSGLIDEEDGVGSWCDRLGDFREVQVHRLGIAEGQDQSRALALFRADGTEDIGRCGSLIPRRALASSARCRFIASVLQKGRIRAAPLPCFGQMAPKI